MPVNVFNKQNDLKEPFIFRIGEIETTLLGNLSRNHYI
jgi:hypothetical protein